MTNVLVHCYAGISRSATVVIAYLMKKRDIGHRQAMSLVSQYRPQINPNSGVKSIYCRVFEAAQTI